MQTKRRPAVVLSSAVYHAARPDVIVGLVAGQTAKSTVLTDVMLQDGSPPACVSRRRSARSS